MSQAGTAVEGTGNHAFGTVLLTFDERIESFPVLAIEEVAQLEVALFVANIEFRVVFINCRVEFRTDRDVKMRAVTDQSKECKGNRKEKATLESTFIRLGDSPTKYGIQCITRNTQDNENADGRKPAAQNHVQSYSQQNTQTHQGATNKAKSKELASAKNNAQSRKAKERKFNERRHLVNHGAKERTRNPNR